MLKLTLSLNLLTFMGVIFIISRFNLWNQETKTSDVFLVILTVGLSIYAIVK